LEQKRKLIPEFLDSAQMLHRVNIDEIEPKFKRWLCSGEKKTFTREEAEKVYEIWNLLKEIAYGSNYLNEDDRRSHFIYTYEPDQDDFYDPVLTNFFNGEQDSDDSEDPKVMDEKLFFEWLLDYTIPENVIFEYPRGKPIYQFPDVTCLVKDCPCNMEPDGLKEFHGLEIRNEQHEDDEAEEAMDEGD
jgi:hypothetical protein